MSINICDICYEQETAIPDCLPEPFTLVLGLTGETGYYVWFTDYHGNKYNQLMFSDGSGDISFTQGEFDNYGLTPMDGSFYEVTISTSINSETFETIIVNGVKYTCILLTFRAVTLA